MSSKKYCKPSLAMESDSFKLKEASKELESIGNTLKQGSDQNDSKLYPRSSRLKKQI